MDAKVLKELYEAREQADQKKQKTAKSHVGARGTEKGKKAVAFEDNEEEELGSEDTEEKEWLELDSWASDTVQNSPSSPASIITLATPVRPQPSTPLPKPSKVSFHHPISSPKFPVRYFTRSRVSRSQKK